MESHIERLTAACGLRHFSYRTFGAPEIIIEASAPEPELEAAVTLAPEAVEAEAAPAPAAVPPLVIAAAPPMALPLPSAGSPPIRLSQPPEDQPAAASLPARRAPVVLPPPEAPVIASVARGSRQAPSGRPPVVLPDPDAFDPIIAFRGREARPVAERRAPTPPPSPARRDAPPRRFALLDEITPARPPVPPDRRTPTPPPAGQP